MPRASLPALLPTTRRGLRSGVRTKYKASAARPMRRGLRGAGPPASSSASSSRSSGGGGGGGADLGRGSFSSAWRAVDSAVDGAAGAGADPGARAVAALTPDPLEYLRGFDASAGSDEGLPSFPPSSARSYGESI
jgi:hypothetical protein